MSTFVPEIKADFLLNMTSILPKPAHIKHVFLIVLVLLFSIKVSAHEPTEPDSLDNANAKATEHNKAADHNKHEDKVNIQEVAFDHVLDAHSWHLWGDHEHPVSFSLPVILKTDKGLVFFSSGEFHHDTHGKVVVEKNGERFVNYKEDIYYASESMNAEGEYVEFAVNEKERMW